MSHRRAQHRRSRSLAACIVALGVGILLVLGPGRSVAAPQPLASRALSLCRQADHAPADRKRPLLRQGLEDARAAVHVDDADPDAHFAAFCNLGKLMRLDGVSWSSFVRLHELRREVDRTLDLQPDNVDALLGKAALLYYTPRLLGGDPAVSEHLLRAAVSLAPHRVDARLALARLLSAQGKTHAARAAAEGALGEARKDGGAAQVTETRKLLDTLDR